MSGNRYCKSQHHAEFKNPLMMMTSHHEASPALSIIVSHTFTFFTCHKFVVFVTMFVRIYRTELLYRFPSSRINGYINLPPHTFRSHLRHILPPLVTLASSRSAQVSMVSWPGLLRMEVHISVNVAILLVRDPDRVAERLQSRPLQACRDDVGILSRYR